MVSETPENVREAESASKLTGVVVLLMEGECVLRVIAVFPKVPQSGI